MTTVGWIPALQTDSGEIVPLAHFMRAIRQKVDREQMAKELPTLSQDQIEGALAFLELICTPRPYHAIQGVTT